MAFSIFDSKLLKKYKKKGPDIVSHVHPHDLYDHFDEQWERDLADGYESITQADTIEELAQKAGIDPEGLAAQVEEYKPGLTRYLKRTGIICSPLQRRPSIAAGRT